MSRHSKYFTSKGTQNTISKTDIDPNVNKSKKTTDELQEKYQDDVHVEPNDWIVEGRHNSLTLADELSKNHIVAIDFQCLSHVIRWHNQETGLRTDSSSVKVET